MDVAWSAELLLNIIYLLLKYHALAKKQREKGRKVIYLQFSNVLSTCTVMEGYKTQKL